MRNTYFSTCPCCGANLDPGEKCDCQTIQIAQNRSRAVSMVNKKRRPRKALKTADRSLLGRINHERD